MSEKSPAFQDAAYLTGSPKRVAVLRELEDDPARPCEVTEEVDASRTTVQRVLSGLVDRSWAIKRDGEYCITPTGRWVLEQYESLSTVTAASRDLESIAPHLVAVDDAPPIELLADGEITVATEERPLAAVDAFVEWFRDVEGERIRALTPIVARRFNDVGHQLVADGHEIELLIDLDVLERSTEAFAAATADSRASGSIDINVYPDSLDVGVTLDEQTVCVSVTDDNSNFRGLVVSEDPSLRDWATTHYDDIYEDCLDLDTALDRYCPSFQEE